MPEATASRGRAAGFATAVAVARTIFSSSVLQAWHSGQRPLQRTAFAPHSRQTYSVLAFATRPHSRPLSGEEKGNRTCTHPLSHGMERGVRAFLNHPKAKGASLAAHPLL